MDPLFVLSFIDFGLTTFHTREYLPLTDKFVYNLIFLKLSLKGIYKVI